MMNAVPEGTGRRAKLQVGCPTWRTDFPVSRDTSGECLFNLPLEHAVILSLRIGYHLPQYMMTFKARPFSH